MFDQPVDASLRLITASGALLYSLSPSAQASQFQIYLTGVATAYTFYAFGVWLRKFPKYDRFTREMVAVDLISAFVLLMITVDTEDTDGYLLLIPPLILASRNLNYRGLIITFGAACSILLMANAAELFISPEIFPINPQSLTQILFSSLYDLTPRVLMLLLVTFYSSEYLKRGKELQQQIYKIHEQRRELETVRGTFLQTMRGANLVSRLQTITRWAASELNSSGCKVYVRHNENLYLVALTADTKKTQELPQIGYALPIQEGEYNGVVINALLQKKLINIPHYGQSKYHISKYKDVFDAMIALPLLDEREEVFAVIAVFDEDGSKVYTNEDEERLRELEPYFGLTILERLLYRRIELRQQLRVVLNETSWRFNASLDLSATLQAVVDGTHELIRKYHAFSLLFPDQPFPGVLDPAPLLVCILLAEERSSMVKIVISKPSEYLEDLNTKFGSMRVDGPAKGLSGQAFVDTTEVKDASGEFLRKLAGRTIVCNNVPIEKPNNYIKFHDATTSELAVPLRIGEKVIAVINIEHAKENAFPDELIELTELLAAQAASAIQNALQVQRIEVERYNLTQLYNLIFSLAETRNNLKSFTAQVLDKIRQNIISYNRATLQFVDIQSDQRKMLATYGMNNTQRDTYLERAPSKDLFLRDFLESKRTQIHYYPNKLPPPYWEELPATKDILVWIGIPLLDSDECYGLITLDVTDNAVAARGLDVSIAVLDMVGRYATIFLRNAMLLQENNTQFKELQDIKESLQEVLDAYKYQFDLARIALIHGETMHYGQSQLGDALVKLKDIENDAYITRMTHIHLKIIDTIENIESYIQKLTDIYEQASELKVRRFNVHKLIDRVATSKQRDWITYDTHTLCKANPSTVNAPEAQIKQVFYVLVENAIQAISSSRRKTGKITFITENGTDKHGDYVLIQIKDNGPGIPEEKIEGLFRLKSTFDPTKKRSGHGLPWAKGFMTSIRGDVSLVETGKMGTIMAVRIYTQYGLLGIERKKRGT